ncbi:quinone oxidoreductase-like protein 1 isoform X6 [Saccopteryx bilineata]|uniref:quinone oxidoreductase-like protein 1 isoform X6 n=1 Tax=Saccopteryx bilineata TaxID=59482 RepID=UPI00338DCDD6
MKGLYFQQSSTNEEITFVFQERENLPVTEDNYVKLQVKVCALSHINTKLLAELKMEKDLFPVGREIAGIVLDEPARQSTCRWRPPPPLTASAVVLLFSWSNSYLVYTMKIKLVGSKVSFFQPDDEVVGILPLDTEDPGLCEVVRVHEHYLVHKPEKVTWAEAAGTVRDGVRAYTALHYLSHLSPGKSVLIMDGASALGTIAVQLAHHRGAKVISTAHSLEDKQYLERLRPSIGLAWMNPFHCMRRRLPWRLFRKIKGEKSKLFSFNCSFPALSWMNPFQYLKPALPWKLCGEVKEDKSKLFHF